MTLAFVAGTAAILLLSAATELRDERLAACDQIVDCVVEQASSKEGNLTGAGVLSLMIFLIGGIGSMVWLILHFIKQAVPLSPLAKDTASKNSGVNRE